MPGIRERPGSGKIAKQFQSAFGPHQRTILRQGGNGIAIAQQPVRSRQGMQLRRSRGHEQSWTEDLRPVAVAVSGGLPAIIEPRPASGRSEPAAAARSARRPAGMRRPARRSPLARPAAPATARPRCIAAWSANPGSGRTPRPAAVSQMRRTSRRVPGPPVPQHAVQSVEARTTGAPTTWVWRFCYFRRRWR